MIETEVCIMNMIEEEIIHLTLLFKNFVRRFVSNHILYQNLNLRDKLLNHHLLTLNAPNCYFGKQEEKSFVILGVSQSEKCLSKGIYVEFSLT